QVHAGDGARQVPEVEAGVHLEQEELAVRSALEVELRHALQAEPLDAMAADLVQVALVSRLEGRGMTELARPGPQLAARELAGHVAAVVHVHVVALDALLASRDEL